MIYKEVPESRPDESVADSWYVVDNNCVRLMTDTCIRVMTPGYPVPLRPGDCFDITIKCH